MKKVIIGIALILVILLTGCGKNIPTIAQAKYAINSAQVSPCIIYTDSYTVVDGVLYIDDYWAYKSGSVFNPTYEHYNAVLATTKWGIHVRSKK